MPYYKHSSYCLLRCPHLCKVLLCPVICLSVPGSPRPLGFHGFGLGLSDWRACDGAGPWLVCPRTFFGFLLRPFRFLLLTGCGETWPWMDHRLGSLCEATFPYSGVLFFPTFGLVSHVLRWSVSPLQLNFWSQICVWGGAGAGSPPSTSGTPAGCPIV